MNQIRLSVNYLSGENTAVQFLVVRVDIGVVIYEAMTPQCGRSVVKVLVIRVDIGVVTYEPMTPQKWRPIKL